MNKNLWVSAAYLIMVSSISSSAVAADQEYFVELGDDLQKEAVTPTWQKLKKDYSAQLGKLTLFPKDIFQGGQVVATRIQAGPIGEKTQAHDVCKRLFRDDVPCFVIEGVKDLPPMASVNISETGMTASGEMLPLPWLQSNSGEAQARVVRVEPAKEAKAEPFIPLPWLTSEKESQAVAEVPLERKRPQENAQAQAHAADKVDRAALEEMVRKEADVKVAEAIRVPLTTDGTVKPSASIAVASLPELSPAAGRGIYTPTQQQAADTRGSTNSGAGWLKVDAFLNQEIASSLWDEVRMGMPEKTKDLSSEIASVDEGADKAQLRVGPFAHSQAAFAFCDNALQASGRGLKCEFMPNDAGMANGQVLTLNNSRADAYQQRRTTTVRKRPTEQQVASPQLPGRQRPVLNTAQQMAELAPAAGRKPINQYWVQVVSANTHLDALRQWEDVKVQNASVLGNLRSSVSTAANDSSTFVVRVGPIANNDDAIRVCSQLQQRNVSCRVLLYTTANSSVGL